MTALDPDVLEATGRVVTILPGHRCTLHGLVHLHDPPEVVADLAMSWIACVGGASTEEEYLGFMRDAGFENIELTRKPAGPLLTPDLKDPMWQAAVEVIGQERIDELADTIFSYSITAEKQ